MCLQTVALSLLLPFYAVAQAPTRAAEIEKKRDEKAARLKPEELSHTEKRLLDFRDKHYMERFAAGYHGFRPKIGNMVTGGGFAIGPEYYRNGLADGLMNIRASAQISTRNYHKLEAGMVMPSLAKGKITFDAVGVHRYMPSLQYYGSGPDRPQDFRANYLLEDTSIDGTVALRPWKSLIFGGTSGALWTNVGPGRDSRFASAETVFPPSIAPGIDRQTDYLRNGIYAQWDYRDNPASPKQGGNYIAQYTWYHDNRAGIYSFRRLDLDLQQYIGFLNKTHVIALRAKARLSDTDRNEVIPFYMQPFLGGSDDLRGYRPFRFNDRNMMVLNAEYRWEIFSGLDGAIFADAGKVFPRRGLLNFNDLESSVGFGLRFNARNRTAVRVDVGFSHEGFQIWFKFNDIFATRRFGSSAGQPLY